MNEPTPPGSPPANNSFAPLVSDTPPSSSTPQVSSTSPSPAAAGADGAEAKALALVTDLEDLVSEAKTRVNALVADFETALAGGHQEIAAITNELKNGGIVARLGALELAVASHAAPMIMQAGHDGLDLLHTWFAGVKERFDRMVAGVAEEKAKAAEAAKQATAQAG